MRQKLASKNNLGSNNQIHSYCVINEHCSYLNKYQIKIKTTILTLILSIRIISMH